MRIALIITGLGMGGAERQVCDLADQFSVLGHKVLLISLTGKALNRPVSSNVEVIELNMKKSIFGFFVAYKRTRKLIKEFEPDVLHSHMIHSNIFARLLRLSLHMKKLICTAHNTYEGNRIRMFAYRITDSLCDLSTNVSQEAVDAFIKKGAVPEGRMCAVHNGIDTERFKFDLLSRIKIRAEMQMANDMQLILAVGRLNLQKDYQNLLVAFSKVITSGYPAQLVIIGAGEEESKLIAMVDMLGLNECVRFLGIRHNVHEWMSAADIFVLSSAWEGFGLVVAEAMACERIVVATDCGGVKEVLGNCGILVPAKNSNALASGLIQGLILNKNVVQDKAHMARKRVIDHYSLRVQVDCWLALYQ